ncbi:hypothetical protein H0H92_009467 [Tricholoma furcatifolium]|nr:hypothetical protein H0H92_009467 [Tricholoma furcatifolium]
MTTSSPSTSQLAIPLHVSYIKALGDNKDDLAYHLTAHLRLNAVYWGLTALCIMGHKDALDRQETIDFVMSCWDDEAGAFGAHLDHDAHVHSTLSAIQILLMHDALDLIDIPRPSGVFAGDSFGEIDTRFLYCAVSALSLLGQLHLLDGEPKERTVQYIIRCRNFDGGFGNVVGAESHAAQGLSASVYVVQNSADSQSSGLVFVCTAALAILDRLDVIDVDTLGWWLCERQLPNGGLNGRPEKLEDVCYSFWVLSAMAILEKIPWIDSDKLISFILSAQDLEGGGIADRPGDMVDVFHTHFGIAGLSLLGYPGLMDLDPVYCMPASVIEARGLRAEIKKALFEPHLVYSVRLGRQLTMNSPPPLSSEHEESPTVTSTIFCAPDADVVFQSSDNVLFHIHRKNLEAHAAAFPPSEFDTKGEVVSLTEDASTLSTLFQFIYPRRHPDVELMSFDELYGLAEAAEKYEFYGVMSVCKGRLKQKFVDDHPVAILNYACKHDYPDIMNLAAPALLDERLDQLVLILLPELVIPWVRPQYVIGSNGFY